MAVYAPDDTPQPARPTSAPAYAPSPLQTTGYAVPAPAPAPPSVQPTYPASPLPGAPATGVYPPSNLGPLSHAIEHHESGGDPNALSPKGARGPRQIMPGTFKQWAKPGEDINNPADNRAVSDRMLSHYLQVYGDPQRAAVAYFSGPGNVSPPGSPTPWIRNTGDGNNSVAQYVAATAGRMGAYAGAKPATTGMQTATAGAATAAPATGGGIGDMLKTLTQEDAKGKSPLSNMGDQLSPAPKQTQTASAPTAFPMPQPDMSAPSQQLLAQVIQNANKPLTWSSSPGGGAGQQALGTTLNS